MGDLVLKYFGKGERNVFHSTAYGDAQNEGRIGVASTENFQDRMKIERNRQVVRGYLDSKIVQSSMGTTKPGIYTTEGDSFLARDRGAETSNYNGGAARMASGVRMASEHSTIKPMPKPSAVRPTLGASVSPPTRKNPGISR